jgi:nitrite reductase/ring-hydroxylating ferredoxin subunit
MTAADHCSGGLCRRHVLRGAAVGAVALPLLAACGGSASNGGSGGSGGSAPVKVPVAEVPVGGGKILPEQQVVVTQPVKGEFKAFTAVCTHQGCTVSKIEDGQIVCPCHGSRFSIQDGSNTAGPNGGPAGSTADLPAKKVSVSGGQVSVSS